MYIKRKSLFLCELSKYYGLVHYVELLHGRIDGDNDAGIDVPSAAQEIFACSTYLRNRLTLLI